MTATVLPYTRDDAERERHRLAAALRGRYTLQELLGRGGMSAVYSAREHALDRRVALKVLLPVLGERLEDRERFRREARVVAGLAHPSIVAVHAVGDAGGLPFFTMPYLEGGSLAGRLGAHERLDIAAACRMLAQLAEALDVAHRRGVVHRDLKPENVLLDGERPVLIDFGVATVSTSDHSRSEVARAFGTVAYMSPEQALGEQECDGRSDLYSLGVLGFRMLAGREPFLGATAREVVAQHVARPAPPVGAFRPDVPAPLERVLLRCLAKAPADRWPDGASLRDALLAAVAPAPTPVRRWWRR